MTSGSAAVMLEPGENGRALVPRPEHRYVSFLNIALVLNRITGEWTVENVNEEFALLLTELGHE